MMPDDQTDLRLLRAERDRLLQEKTQLGRDLAALDALLDVSRLRRRVLWTAVVVLLLSPLVYGVLYALAGFALWGVGG